MTLTELISLVGLCFGLAGFVLGTLNFLRDRHRIDITLQWDLNVTEDSGYDHNKNWGAIRVTNSGRRASYISHVAITLPPEYGQHLVIMGGIKGQKLSEGDPTAVFIVSQDGMEAYSKDWKKIVAQVSDTTGRTWYSKRPKGNERPSWAET